MLSSSGSTSITLNALGSVTIAGAGSDISAGASGISMTPVSGGGTVTINSTLELSTNSINTASGALNFNPATNFNVQATAGTITLDSSNGSITIASGVMTLTASTIILRIRPSSPAGLQQRTTLSWRWVEPRSTFWEQPRSPD